jgi:rhodanese-related sulfurtransferase
MNVPTISPRALADLCSRQQVELIDVRTPAEFDEVHLAAAKNIPLDRLSPSALMTARENGKAETHYFICHAGSRGKQACEKFVSDGYANVANVEGGTEACIAAGLPVVRGRKTVSLERQVRIAAGSMVLVGAVLAWSAHPAFLALSAFIGAGLVFSGVTDTCGMGLVLARMPWNQSSSSPATCSIPTN